MAFFDFLKSHEEKLHEREEEIEALEQQIISLRNEMASEEKKRDNIRKQIVELENQEMVQKIELYDLQNDKEKIKKQYDRIKERHKTLYGLLTKSTKKLKCLDSSDKFLLVDVASPYLVALDEKDFEELCKYHNLREENRSYYDKKEQREKELKSIELEIEKRQKELDELKVATIQQREALIKHKRKMEEFLAAQTKEKNKSEDYSMELNSHKKDILRYELMHEIYQRVSACEDEALRKLRENLEAVSLTDLQERIKLERNIVRNDWPIKDEKINYFLKKLCDEFIQLNIVKLVKEMKSSDWESIKIKIGAFTQIVNSLLYTNGYSVRESYFETLTNLLEAKFIYIQKQELEREKEREEREAQREYERAIKKALKDEEKAQEALEQKKREMAEAQTQEKIQKLQEQIQGLENALVEARELRERAMSMAQQTKIGYVYVISNIGSFGKDIYKIGMTRRLDPMERVLELSNASVPFPFDVHTFIYSEDAPALEADLHKRFDAKKVNSINYRKEYFRVTLDEIKAALEEKGIDTNFIDEPDAFQYRESMVKEQQQQLFHS